MLSSVFIYNTAWEAEIPAETLISPCAHVHTCMCTHTHTPRAHTHRDAARVKYLQSPARTRVHAGIKSTAFL